MNEKIINMIIELAETGSSTAFWLYLIYVLGSVSKFMIAFGCLFLSICKFCAALRTFSKEKK